MPIIDFHLHLFSRTYFETLAALSPLPGDVESKLADVERRLGLELPSRDLPRHVGRWIASMDEHGVEHVAAFASVPEEIPVLAQVRALSGRRMTPFALVNPKAPGCVEKVEALIASQGFAGVLLFPALHHYEYSGPECAALFAVLDRHRAVAFAHCGELVVKLRDVLGIPRTADPKFANPLELARVAQLHPEARFVIPHFGAGRFEETLEAGRRASNILVDTSSSNSWMSAQQLDTREVFARALEVFTPSRIVFGTDSTTFPRGWQRARYDEQLAALTALGRGAADLAAIFNDNASALLARVG